MAPLERDRFIQIRATPEEVEMLTALAEAAGLTTSDFLRTHIRTACEQKLPDLFMKLGAPKKFVVRAWDGARATRRVGSADTLKEAKRIADEYATEVAGSRWRFVRVFSATDPMNPLHSEDVSR